jgi:AMIN domain
MKASSRVASACTIALALVTAGLWSQFALAQAGTPVSVERVAVVGSEQGVGVQISASGPVTTEAQILTGPDRLVIDFPGALPGRELRGLRLNQGQIKAVRAGLFRSNPPVTRIVVDLNAPTAYRLVSADKAVIVKLGTEPAMASAQSFPGVTIERHPTARALEALKRGPEPPLRVGFERGLLTISANKATLADVLYQVHLKTGADIAIPSGADQEKVAIQVGPGPAKDVLVALLNGSRFNFILQATSQDPQGIGAVILSPKSNIGVDPPQPAIATPAATTQPDALVVLAPEAGQGQPVDMAGQMPPGTAAVNPIPQPDPDMPPPVDPSSMPDH